ncbi:MAG: DUF58 domain-containing protein, partial [Candidatus Krumholzibacteriia bacterium]
MAPAFWNRSESPAGNEEPQNPLRTGEPRRRPARRLPDLGVRSRVAARRRSNLPTTIPAEVLQKVQRLEIQMKHLVNDIFSGEYHSVFKGRGMEFAEVREYTPGDDIRSIDWNVTARLGSPYVKKYVEERELTVMLAVDLSASGFFGSGTLLKRELATEVCSILAFSAVRNNDKVGCVLFTDDVELFVPPQKGRQHALRVIRDLLYFEPEGRGTDMGTALQFLAQVLKRKAVVFLVSDFLDPGFETPLSVVSRRHDVVPITITDAREEELPDVDLVELVDAETGERMLVDTGSAAVRRRFALRARR